MSIHAQGRGRVRAGLVVALLTALLAAALWPGVAHAERDISRVCPESLASSTQFQDVAPGSTHAWGIYCIRSAGITTGTTPTTYSPDQPVSRGQMATFLRRLLVGTSKPVPDATSHDHGVSGHAHQAAIEALLEAGVIPAEPGSFRPDDPIRRDDMATWMNGTWRWMTGSGVSAEGQPFGDLAGNPHAEDIAGLYVYGVINGKSTGYDPAGAVTRAQMGSFLARLLSMHADAGHYPNVGAVTTTTVAPTTSTTQAPAFVRDTSAEASLFAHHNAQRTSQGLPALGRNTCVDTLASDWARGMAAAGQLSHRPDFGQAGTGQCVPNRQGWYENVGFDQSIDHMAAAFMASAPHRENILRPGINLVGIGAWRDAQGTLWVAVNFVDTP